jgi:hypothetical protein
MEQAKTYQCWTTSLGMSSRNPVTVNAPTSLWAAYDYAGQLLKSGQGFDSLDVFVLCEKDRRVDRFRVTGGDNEETLCARHV